MIVRFINLKFLLLLFFFVGVNSWKKCSETFCARVRQSPQTYPRYTFNLKSLGITDGVVTGMLLPSAIAAPELQFILKATADATFHLVIVNADPSAPKRFSAKDALVRTLNYVKLERTPEIVSDKVTIVSGLLKAIIYVDPFKVEFYNENQLVSVANPEGRLVFEEQVDETAIALDVSFPGAHRAYGLPEHAESLALHTTVLDNEEPYRHFNLDYGRYKVWEREALYGAIPVLYAHATTHSSGFFWLNAAQTWVDIKLSPNQVDAFFMSESGVLELFVMTGTTLPETVKQYTKLTGTAPLPQYFTLGYHQSRYSYMSQDEVKSVVDNFDQNNFPVDVMWLDIDYTQEKKYFTWDPVRFAKPKELLTDLANTNRKLVAIIDPHIKVDNDYFLHKEATLKKYYVQNDDGTDFQGNCWPGLSSYIDFLNPAAKQYYASLYNVPEYHFTEKNIHLWNDMNEPAVFDIYDPHENTIPSKSLHHNGWKHLDVHNMYGFYQTIGTREGLLERDVKVRPFILTRSHFAGIQRYAAIWTGDNYASWNYLQVSFPMCLTEALAGVSFCGADVGGFAGIPDDELYQRWYQAGAWLPFYRGHSAIDVPKREPYLYSGDVQARVRTALQQRYAHLPVWYTLFREHELTGEPVIRPITYHYPSEADALSIDNQLLIGADILVAPVLEPGVFMKSVYLPGGKSQLWYNIDENYQAYRGTGRHTIDITLDSIPVFYRGGSIITRKNQPRATTVDTVEDPYTVYVSLDDNNNAKGSLYVDDYETFSYTENKYLYNGFTFSDNILNSKPHDTATYDGVAGITQIIFIKPPENIGTAKVTVNGNADEAYNVKVIYSEDGRILNLIGFSLSLQQPFTIELS